MDLSLRTSVRFIKNSSKIDNKTKPDSKTSEEAQMSRRRIKLDQDSYLFSIVFLAMNDLVAKV